MNKTLTKGLIIAFGWAAVLYPLWIVVRETQWAWDSTLLLNIFPLFGILAFTLLWLHAISGVFEPWLVKQINFDEFVHVTAMLILISIIMHPLLLLFNVHFHFSKIFMFGDSDDIWLAIIGWFLLISYDIGKALKKHSFFVRHWHNILTISTIGFLLTFFHSLGIGGDLQSGAIRIVWIFYGVTAILATIYTYGIKRFFSK